MPHALLGPLRYAYVDYQKPLPSFSLSLPVFPNQVLNEAMLHRPLLTTVYVEVLRFTFRISASYLKINPLNQILTSSTKY